MQPAQGCGAAGPGHGRRLFMAQGSPWLPRCQGWVGIPGARGKPWPGSVGCICSCGQPGAPRGGQGGTPILLPSPARRPCTAEGRFSLCLGDVTSSPSTEAWWMFSTPAQGCRGCPGAGALGRAVLGAGRVPAVTLSRGACRREAVLPGHHGHDPPVPGLVQPHAELLQGVLDLLYPLPAAGEHRAPTWGWRSRGEELLSLHLSLPSERGSSCWVWSGAALVPVPSWAAQWVLEGVWGGPAGPCGAQPGQDPWGQAVPQRHVTPACSALQITLIWIFLDSYSVPLYYDIDEFPTWGMNLGICMGVLTCLPIPLWAVVALYRESGSLSEVSVRGGMGHGDGVGAEQGLPRCWGRGGRGQRWSRDDAVPSPRERKGWSHRAGARGGVCAHCCPFPRRCCPLPRGGLGAAPDHPLPPTALPESHPAPRLLEDRCRPGRGQRCHVHVGHHHCTAPRQQRGLMLVPGHPTALLRAPREDGTRWPWGRPPRGWLLVHVAPLVPSPSPIPADGNH